MQKKLLCICMCVCVCVNMHAVKSGSGPILAIWTARFWTKLTFRFWTKMIYLAYIYCGFKQFVCANVSLVRFGGLTDFSQCCKNGLF